MIDDEVSKEETLLCVVVAFEQAKFNIACFVDAFKRYLIKAQFLDK